MDIPDWVGRWLATMSVTGVVAIATIAGAHWQMKRRGLCPEAEIRAPGLIIGTGWMCVAAVILFGLAGLAGDVLDRGPDQFIPWGGLVGFFALGAAAMFLETRAIVRFDDTGLTWRGRLAGWRFTAWSDVQRVVHSEWSYTLVFKLRNGRQVIVSEYSEGVGDLLETAYIASVPGVGRLEEEFLH